MFSVDHLYGLMAQARAFLEQIPVSAADKATELILSFFRLRDFATKARSLLAI